MAAMSGLADVQTEKDTYVVGVVQLNFPNSGLVLCWTGHRRRTRAPT
ncbi:hypothetical protein [Streptomyces sp. NPDC048473]